MGGVKRLILTIVVALGLGIAAGASAQTAPTTLEGTFLKEGVLGAIIVALGVAVIWQARQLKQVQDARVSDAKKVVRTLLELQEKWNDSVSRLGQAIDRIDRRGESR